MLLSVIAIDGIFKVVRSYPVESSARLRNPVESSVRLMS